MCLIEANIKRDRFLDAVHQVKELVNKISPEVVPDDFWEEAIDKVEKEVS